MTEEEKKSLLEDSDSIQKGKDDIIFFIEEVLGCELNCFQKRILERTCYDEHWSEQNLVIAGNRIGKTVLLAFKHIWFAFYKRGLKGDPNLIEKAIYRTFIISPISRQAKEVIRYIEQILGGNFSWERDGERYSNGKKLKIFNFLTSTNKALGEIGYANNSISYCFSTIDSQGSSFQGLPAGYISFDEVVQTQHFQSDVASMINRLGDYGQQFDLITTPDANPERANAQQEIYHLVQEAREGKNDFLLLNGSFDENIFIPEEKREKQKARIKSMAPGLYDQIIKGEFIVLGRKMFDTVQVEQIFKWDKKREEQIAEEGAKYVMVIDWGFADKGDETVIMIFRTDQKPYEIVWDTGVQGADPLAMIGQVYILKELWNNCDVVMDINAMGGTIMKKMLTRLRTIGFNAITEKKDAIFHLQCLLSEGRKQVREDGVLKDKVENFGLIRSYFLSKLANQLAIYQLKDDRIGQDWVSVLYMFAWYIRYKMPMVKPKVININLY